MSATIDTSPAAPRRAFAELRASLQPGELIAEFGPGRLVLRRADFAVGHEPGARYVVHPGNAVLARTVVPASRGGDAPDHPYAAALRLWTGATRALGRYPTAAAAHADAARIVAGASRNVLTAVVVDLRTGAEVPAPGEAA